MVTTEHSTLKTSIFSKSRDCGDSESHNGGNGPSVDVRPKDLVLSSLREITVCSWAFDSPCLKHYSAGKQILGLCGSALPPTQLSPYYVLKRISKILSVI